MSLLVHSLHPLLKVSVLNAGQAQSHDIKIVLFYRMSNILQEDGEFINQSFVWGFYNLKENAV